MSADRVGFNDPVEGVVYLDSSFVIALLDDPEPHHAACVAFRRRLEEGTVLPAVTDLVYEEVTFHRLRARLAEVAERLRIPWRQVARRDPTAFDRAMAEVDTRRNEIEAFTLSLPISEAVRPRAFDLMRRFRLLPADAFHIAAALEHEVTAFVTLDADFLAVDGITVYTCV